jgi:predicted RNase H-like nuclease (RuvC/YqgF family)
MKKQWNILAGNNRGSGIIVVLISMVCVGLMGASLLFMSYTAIRLKATERQASKDFYSAEPSRVQAFIKGCPGLQLTIKRDIAGYVKELDRIKGEQEKQAQITNPREVESAKARIESLKKQNHAVRQKIEKLKDIPGMEL